MTGRAIVLRGDAARLPLPDSSVDAVVCDPPYGLEFMGREWDTFRTGDGFRRSRNEADAGRDNVFGRTSSTSPEYLTGKPPAARIRRPSERDQSSGRAHNATTSLVARNAPEAYVAGQPFQQWCETWAAECLRVLKPGGYMLAFGGTRTWHRLACAVEDAGFEIRDSISWLYGSGFPKSLDVSKAIDKAAGAEREVTGPPPYTRGKAGQSYSETRRVSYDYPPHPATAPATEEAARWEGWGTALKPAHEPIVVARKPLAGTVAANVLEHGTGAMNIDGCRVAAMPGDYDHPGNDNRAQTGMYNRFEREGRQAPPHNAGRWPPNVLLGEEAAAELDRQSGVSVSTGGSRGAGGRHGAYSPIGAQPDVKPGFGDVGGASRFFPVFRYEPKAGTSERPSLPDGTQWPTVKPVPLMQWLVRLVTPSGGKVLDLFAGTGTTGHACAIEGFDCILLDKDPVAIALTRVRLAKPVQPSLFGEAS